jgi:gas vesicle protein
MREKKMGEWGPTQSFLTFAIGLGVGATLAILFAPKSGEETRHDLLDAATDTIDDAVATGRHLKRRTRRVVDDVTERMMDAAEVGQQAYREADAETPGSEPPSRY